MGSKMLIDASHREETRVVVARGNRIEEFDFESASRKPLKGNIYLAKVTRVEPSLQAAFVEYGGNRHGFLAFAEIHPDYYQIPVADRLALLKEQEEEDAQKMKKTVMAIDNGHGRPGDPGQPMMTTIMMMTTITATMTIMQTTTHRTIMVTIMRKTIPTARKTPPINAGATMHLLNRGTRRRDCLPDSISSERR